MELNLPQREKFDASNPLLLPSQKRKTRLKKDAGTVTKILSKKQRKKLEKIVEKKKKKENVSTQVTECKIFCINSIVQCC